MWRVLDGSPRVDNKFDELDHLAFVDLERAKAAVSRFRRERDCGQATDRLAFDIAYLLENQA